MVPMFVFIATICIAVAALRRFYRRHNLPPGPLSLPIIGNLPWLIMPISALEIHLRRFMSLHGPLVSVNFGDHPFLFIGSHSLAHRALVQNGAAYADRHDISPMLRAVNRNVRYISSSSYGPTWRLLRRNLTREMIQPAQNRAYSVSRRWILSLLIHRLKTESSVQLIDHLEYTVISLLALMCFGDMPQESQIKEIGDIARGMARSIVTISHMDIFPHLGRILFRRDLKDLIQVLDDANRVFIPLIRARINSRKQKGDHIVTYVDTLMDLHLPEENRALEEAEMVTLCGEFFVGGNDTTITTVEWIMANLVKHPECQSKLYNEIEGVVGKAPPILFLGGDGSLERVVEEVELEKIPYLKAVVLEGLRLHPPGHYVMPHKLKEDVELDGYAIKKNTVVNFMVAGMGRDPEVWEDPMEFKPERFLFENGETFDITGSREIKMMPFGAGRRICPGLWLGLMHLQYIVANLIWYFKWSPIEGREVDLTEKQEFITVMKNPLQANICLRNIT